MTDLAVGGILSTENREKARFYPMYTLYHNDPLRGLLYMNRFANYGDACDERDRLHRLYGGEYTIQWEEA